MKNCSASLDTDILFKGYEWDGQAGFIAFFLNWATNRDLQFKLTNDKLS